MPIIAKESESKPFHITPVGNHQAVCFDIWDLGFQKKEWQGKVSMQHKIMIGWELNERISSADEWNGTRYRIYKRYGLTLHKKSNLTHDCESWRGKAFTDEERQGFDIEKLIGANCLLNIIHTESNGKTYANISSVSALPKGMPKIEPETKRSTPEWIKKIQDQALSPNTPVVSKDHGISEEEELEEAPF